MAGTEVLMVGTEVLMVGTDVLMAYTAILIAVYANRVRSKISALEIYDVFVKTGVCQSYNCGANGNQKKCLFLVKIILKNVNM